MTQPLPQLPVSGPKRCPPYLVVCLGSSPCQQIAFHQSLCELLRPSSDLVRGPFYTANTVMYVCNDTPVGILRRVIHGHT